MASVPFVVVIRKGCALSLKSQCFNMRPRVKVSMVNVKEWGFKRFFKKCKKSKNIDLGDKLRGVVSKKRFYVFWLRTLFIDFGALFLDHYQTFFRSRYYSKIKTELFNIVVIFFDLGIFFQDPANFFLRSWLHFLPFLSPFVKGASFEILVIFKIFLTFIFITLLSKINLNLFA